MKKAAIRLLVDGPPDSVDFSTSVRLRGSTHPKKGLCHHMCIRLTALMHDLAPGSLPRWTSLLPGFPKRTRRT